MTHLVLPLAALLSTILPLVFGILPMRFSCSYLLSVGISFILCILVLLSKRQALLKSLHKLLIVIISTSLTFAVADLIARPLLKSKIYYRPHEILGSIWPQFPELLRYTPNQRYRGPAYGDLAYLSGNQSLRNYRTINFNTDSYGFRNKIRTTHKAYDLIVLGDSFTVGLGTTQDQIWPELLSSKYSLHTYNLGFQGSPWSQYINLQLELPNILTKPNTILVWMIFAGNDLFEYYGSTLDPKKIVKNNEWNIVKLKLNQFQKASPIRKLISTAIRPFRQSKGVHWQTIRKSLPNQQEILFYKYYTQVMNRSEQEIVQLPNYTKLREIIISANSYLKEKNITPLIVLAPSKAEVFSWLINDEKPWSNNDRSGFSIALQKICTEQNISFLDLKPTLLHKSQSELVSNQGLLWWNDDSHWNEFGHAAVAEVLFQYLTDYGLLESK